MKSIVLKYGLAGLAVGMASFLLTLAFDDQLSYRTLEVLGYLAIIISLSLVFFAIRQYRDKELGGRLSIKDGLLMGMLVTLFVGVGIAAADAIYTTQINPGFIAEYTDHSLAQMKMELPAEEFEVEKTKLLDQIEKMGSPAMLAGMMFVTVVIIGFIVSLVSSLVLKR